MKYDVFISCKSEDYAIGEKLYNYLKNDNHFSVFFATQEIKDIGKDDYGSVIDKALDASTHLIVIATKLEYIEEDTSPYVYYEWSSFCKEKRAGRKAGNVISLLPDNISKNTLPWALRNLQSISISKFEEVIDFIKNFSYTDSLDTSSIANTGSLDNYPEDCTFLNTYLWKRTLGINDKQISPLRESFLKSRELIKILLERQRTDFAGIAYETIEQIDFFWEIVDILCKQRVPINPIEGYVLGMAFLLSSPLLSISSTKGKTAIKDSIEWKDLIVGLDLPLEARVENDSCLSALRALHFREISSILSSHIAAINGYIIQEEKIRRCFSQAIETLLKYNGFDWDDFANLKIVPNRYMEYRQRLTIDLQKLSAIYRCANTMNIFYGRIPDYLFGILKKHYLNLDRWSHDNFTYQIVEDADSSNLLSLVSSFPFNKDDFHKWNVLYEVVNIIDNDIKATNSILKQKNINLPYLGLAGTQSIQKLKESLPTEDWEPCSIGVHVGDLKYLIINLGGTQLYGSDDCLSVIIREMIQNGRDAIKSRENMDYEFNRGAIYIHLTELEDCYQLDIADNGIGMSKSCIQNHLLCFGESYWSSTLSLRENPGLRSSGFSSIGHYGIGFYSLFMLANYVKVTTHRYTERQGTYTTVEFLDGLTLLPMISQEESQKNKFSTIVSFKFSPENDNPDTNNSWDGTIGRWPFYRRESQKDRPLDKKICYLVAGLDVDIFYSKDNEEYRLIHQNVNNPQFNEEVWAGDLFPDSHTHFDRIIDNKGQLRALLSAPVGERETGGVIPTIRGLSSYVSFDSRLSYSTIQGFIDYKSGNASRNSFILDDELKKLLTDWISEKYRYNYELLLNNWQLARCYIETFRALSMNCLDDFIEENESKLKIYLRQYATAPFKTSTLELIHKRLFVGLYDYFGQILCGESKSHLESVILSAISTLGLYNLRNCIKAQFSPDYNMSHTNDNDSLTKKYYDIDPYLMSDNFHLYNLSNFVTNFAINQENGNNVVKESRLHFDQEKLLKTIDEIPNNLDGIIKRFAIMLILQPFRDGNKRALSIWINYMLVSIGEKAVRWELFNNDDYKLMKSYCINNYDALKQMLLNARISKL